MGMMDEVILDFHMDEQLKTKWHVLGIDDSPFRRTQRHSTLIAVLMSHDFHIDGIMTGQITVDGEDSIDAMLAFVESGFGRAANAVLTNGITFAGFNMYDPSVLSAKTGMPVVSVTRKKPDIGSMKEAIIKHGRDNIKLTLLEKLEPEKMVTGSGLELYVNIAGIDLADAARLIERSIFRGSIPEAVRIAHMVGTVIKNGKTHGRV